MDPAENLDSSAAPCLPAVSGQVKDIVVPFGPPGDSWQQSGPVPDFGRTLAITEELQQGPSSAASQRVASCSSAASLLPGLLPCRRPCLLVLTISRLTFQVVAGRLGKAERARRPSWAKEGSVTSRSWTTPLSLLLSPSFPSILTHESHGKVLPSLLILPQLLLLGYRTW